MKGVYGEDDTKVFMPTNVEYQDYFGYNLYLSGSRITIPVLFAILYWAGVSFFIRPLLVANNKVLLRGMFLLFIVFLIIEVFIVCIFTIDQKGLLKLYNEGYNNPVALSLTDLYDVCTFDEKHHIVKLMNQINGILIQVRRASIIGKGEYFEEADLKARTAFLNRILVSGLKYMYINRYEQIDSLDILDEFSRKIDKHKNENLKALMRTQNGHIKKRTQFNSQIETDYYFVYTDDISKYRNLYEVPRIVRSLRDDGGYGYTKTLNKKEYINLCASLNYIDYPELTEIENAGISNIFKENPIKFIALYDKDFNILVDYEKQKRKEEENKKATTDAKKKGFFTSQTAKHPLSEDKKDTKEDIVENTEKVAEEKQQVTHRKIRENTGESKFGAPEPNKIDRNLNNTQEETQHTIDDTDEEIEL